MKKNEDFSRKSAHFLKSACLAFCLASYGGTIYAASVYAEQTTLTVHMNNRTVKDVFSYIEKNSEFIFVYHGSNIDLNRKVNVDVSNQPVETILNKLFEGTDIEYIINDRQIIVRKNEKLNRPAVTVVPQQEKKRSVTGSVKDSKDEPLIGVNVAVKGTAVGSVTDMNGNFSLAEISPDAVLTISYIGYKTQDIALKGQNALHVILHEDSEALEEVVVIGYGVQKKVNVTGSVGVADAKDLAERPVQNVSQALQGIVPGLNLTVNTNGGRLDNTLSVDIRGLGSIGEGSTAAPLVLIDGVEGNMNALNPNDIESISVLKDVASSSIYGSRAAFGVILITTKKGKAGRTNVSVLSNLRYTGIIHLPKTMDSYKFAKYFNAAAANGGDGAVFSDETLQRIVDYQNGLITDGTIAVNNVWQQDALSNANTDWYRELYKQWTPAQETSVNVSGGNEKVTYFASGGFLNQDGHLNYGKENIKRYNLMANLDAKLSKYVRLGYSTKWIREDLTQPTYLSDLWLYNIMRKWPTKPVYDPNGHPHLGTDIQELTDGGRSNYQTDYVYQSLKLTIEPITGWAIHLEGNYNTYTQFGHSEVLPVYAHYVDETPYLFGLGYDTPGTTRVTENTLKRNMMTLNAYTNYAKQLNSGHSFHIMAGVNAELTKERDLTASMTGLITPSVPTLNTATTDPTASGGYTHWANLGYFGRLNYNYKEKYLFEANLRYDGSSRFIGEERWALFPSFSAGWNLAREDFFQVQCIDILKWRASWGQLGNMNTTRLYPFYQSIPITSQGGLWLLNGERPNISSEPGIVSKNMTWERVESWNVGVDWGLFNNRLTGSFDYFIRKTTGMIGPAPELPATLGTTVPKINNTDMKSQGFELEIGWRDRIENVSYGVKFLLSDARQIITKYPNEEKSLSLAWYPGKRYGDIWGYETVGIAKSDEEMNRHLSQVDQSQIGNQWAAGDIMYADLDRDHKISTGKNTVDQPGDRKIIANSAPRYNYAIALDAAWKGIDLRLFLQGVGKRDYVAGAGGSYFWGITGATTQSVGFEEHWDFFRPEGDELGANLNAYYPRPLFNNYKNQQIQSRYVQNAAYLRLKNIQLGYTLPQNWTTKLGLQSVRFYVSGENLLTFTGLDKMFDPETLAGNWNDGVVYPLNKAVSFGINLNF